VEEVHFLSKKAQTLNITSSNAQVKKTFCHFGLAKQYAISNQLHQIQDMDVT